MQTLTEILDDIYNRLSLSETIDRTSVKKELAQKKFREVWRITTEVEVDSFQKEIILFIAFDDFFPLTIPHFYLSKETFDEIYPIPHLDRNRFVCIFHTESLILDTDKPFEIVSTCLKKTKKIIKDGLNGSNHADFEEELNAYWVDREESDMIHYLSLLSDFPEQTTWLKICKIQPAYNHIQYIIYTDKDDPITKKILDFIETKGYALTENDALFLSDYTIDIKPPFPEDNEDILNTISSTSFASFKQHINSKNTENHIFFAVQTSFKPVLLGWKHKKLITNRNGFRKGSLNSFSVLSKYQKKDKIERIIVNEYSNSRIEQRTSGGLREKYTFLVAGLGSIGSNLIHFLNGFNYPNFKLIDDDVLELENIGRHLLGINHINSFKAEALKSHIENIRPDQDVTIKSTRLESVVINDTVYFNNSSYAFIAIGNQNVENFLIKKQNEDLITVPMFFFWVEPYAIGGHCLFIHPDDKITLDDLYDGHLYRLNIIDSIEYINSNPILSKQEAGCQTSYTPYSGNDVLMFLSSLYRWMNNVVVNKVNRSMAVQWTGNIPLAKELGLTINQPYAANEIFHSKEFYINDGTQKR